MITIAIIAFLFCLLLLKKIRQFSEGGFLNQFYIFFYSFELLISILLVFYDNNYRLYNGLIVREIVASFGIACVVACVAIFGGQLLANSLMGNYKPISLTRKIEYLKNRYRINEVSFFFLLFFCFTIISSLDIAYYIAVLALSFSFSTAFIGLIWTKLSRSNKLLWICALSINFIFHAVQGSRGTAIFPVIFLIMGYLISIKTNKKIFRKWVFIYSVTAVMSLPVLSFIANFREVQGRGLEVNMDNLELLWEVSQKYESSNNNDGIKSSLGRMLISANPAAVYMTPDQVPYRYIEYIPEEIASIFSLAGDEGRESSRTNRGNSGFGTGVATRYGFSVNANTSVEWPVFADGFSRFGYVGLFLYSFIFALNLALLEKFVAKLWDKNALVSMTLTLFILYNGVLSYMYSYYSFLKIIVFRMTLVWIVTYLISIMSKRSLSTKFS